MSFDQNNKTKRKNSTEEHDVKLLTTFQEKKKKKLGTLNFAHHNLRMPMEAQKTATKELLY